MKKLLASVLAVMILLSMTAPAGADGIQSELEDFICLNYDLQPGDFVPAEYYSVHLEYIDLHLNVLYWYSEGSDLRKGVVAWVTETEEFLADDQVSILMEEDRNLAASEYQKLQEEAGKMDIGLYQKLLKDNEDEYEVYISPVYYLSDDLTQQIEALYIKYGLEVPVDTGYSGRVQGYPGERDGAEQDGSMGSTEPALPTPQTLPLPAPAPDPYVPADDTPPPDMGSSTSDSNACDPARDIYQPYPEGFTEALNELYLQGYAPALTSLTAYLDGLGADYQVENGHITATMTAAQIQELEGHKDVQWISSFMDAELDGAIPLPAFAAQDDAEDLVGRTAMTNGESLAVGPADQGKAPWLWSGALLGFLALGVFLIIKK